jgi:hypothetical protein
LLSLPTLPLIINIGFPLQKINNRLPNLFLDLSILILLSGIFKSFSTFVTKLFFDFDILESSKLFSDVHAPLQILLSVNFSNNDINSNAIRKTNHSKAKIKSWENEKVTDFQENIDEEKLHTFEQKLSRWQNEIGVTDHFLRLCFLENLLPSHFPMI